MNRFLFILITLVGAGYATQKTKEGMEQPDRTILADTTHVLSTFTLTNKNGLTMKVTNFGARIISLTVPDRKGIFRDVVLGYDSVDQYPGGNPYFGAMIGRYGNRIGKGKFVLEGKPYQLAVNNGENALHGGPKGFHNAYWDVKQTDPNRLELNYLSKDGEEGYPGNLMVEMEYLLTDDNEVTMNYYASTDKPTVLNLTHHSYFNLAGEGSGSVADHTMMINADYFIPVDKGLIPTGELRRVDGTAFDFRKPHQIGERIDGKDEQLVFGKGYDHNWVLKKTDKSLSLAARVMEPTSGRIMEVWTTEPGIQFYSGNFLNGEKGKGGKSYERRSAFCLEAQHFPDSPNHPAFPSTALKPLDDYKQQTVYKFMVQN